MGILDLLRSIFESDEARYRREAAESNREWHSKHERREDFGVATPGLDAGSLPFTLPPMRYERRWVLDRASGAVEQFDELYLLAPADVPNVQAETTALNSLIEDAARKSGSAVLDQSRINPAYIRGWDSLEAPDLDIRMGLTTLTINHPKGTGRARKYPLELNYSAYRDKTASGDGSHGTVSYTRDGTRGKAWIVC